MKLIIDGNFFAQRIRNAVGLNFINDPEGDTKTFIWECTQSLSREIRSLQSVISDIIICRDFSSWRRDFEQTYPIGTEVDKDEQDYKSNRDGEKDYDEVAFYAAYDKWMDLLEENANIIIVKTYKGEADDAVFVLSQELSQMGHKIINWSSDGDYLQNVNESISLLKFPQRKLMMNKFNSVRKREAGDIFGLNKSDKTQDLIKLFPNEVEYINPMEELFRKVISGDPKDNVPPIFIWKSTTGTRTFRPSNRVFNKAFPNTLFNGKATDIENISEEHLYSEKYMKDLIRNMIIEAKQIPGLDYKLKKKEFTPALEVALQSQELTDYVEHAYKVFISNMKMKHLSYKQIPSEIVNNIISEYDSKVEKSKSQDIEKMAIFESFCNMLDIQQNNNFFKQFELSNADPTNIITKMFG